MNRATLPSDRPLFRRLADLHGALVEENMRTCVIGGMAMLLWADILDVPRDMTQDLDCALLAEDLHDEATARSSLARIDARVRALGFSRPAHWRESRKGRFSYSHSREAVAIEFLCGSLPFGQRSKRPPARKLAELPGDPPIFYAAEVPWIDFVDEWTPVEVCCGQRSIVVWIPDLPGFALLKLGAVYDKLELLGRIQDEDRVWREELRLQRHAGDLELLLVSIDRQGRFDELVQAARRGRVRAVARDVVLWLIRYDARARALGLQGLEARLARIAGARPGA